MARDLKMSVTHFQKIRQKLIPKHLGANKQEIIKQAVRKQILMESPKQVIQKAKLKYLKPIGQIQIIMRHFDAKFSDKKVPAYSQPIPKRKRRHAPSSSSAYENQLELKMSYLLHLPSLKSIQKQAQRYRYMLNSDEIRRKQAIKGRILSRFSDYMEAELKGSPQIQRRSRFHTHH